MKMFQDDCPYYTNGDDDGPTIKHFRDEGENSEKVIKHFQSDEDTEDDFEPLIRHFKD